MSDEQQRCGCPLEYHTADCPLLHGGSSSDPQTKEEYIELMTDDDWRYDDE